MIAKLTIVFLTASVLFGQKSELKNVKVLPFKKKRELVNYMKIVSKELGVKCSFCHIPNDYSSDKKANKTVAREMILMTQNANSVLNLSLIHICRCRRIERCRSRWSPYH